MFNNTQYQIFLNSEVIISKNEKFTFWSNISEQITFLSHSHHDKSVFLGALTDLNVWDRTLANKEVQDFASCGGEEGNYLPWSITTVESHNMMEEDVELEEICAPTTGSLIIGNSRKSLDLEGSQRFCAGTLGGRMAVADSRELFEAGSHVRADQRDHIETLIIRPW